MTEEQAVVAALDDAIQMLEQQRFHEFVDKYVPVDELRRLREANEIDKSIAEMQAHPERLERLLTMLREAQRTTPRLNTSRTEASFGVEMPESAGEPAVVQVIATGASGATGTGYDGDVSAAIDLAIAALDSGDLAGFVERMFPLAELARLRGTQQLATETERLKATPELIQRMMADLQALKGLTPRYEESGNLAIYTIPRGTVEFGRRKVELSPREIRLQKLAGHWRLYDHTSAAHQEIVRQSKLSTPSSTFVVHLKMERIGDDWRLGPLPSQRNRPPAEPRQPAPLNKAAAPALDEPPPVAPEATRAR